MRRQAPLPEHFEFMGQDYVDRCVRDDAVWMDVGLV